MGRFLLVTLSLLVVTLSLNGIGADHHCPSGWSSFETFCYKFIREKKSWNDAEASCVQLQNSSRLVSIHSGAEALHLRTVMPIWLFGDVWTGLNDPGKNRTWKWSDDSDYDYTSWGSSQPGNTDRAEFCVKMTRSILKLEWKATTCESNHYFICKM
uniref:LP-Cac-4 n=1 Tax=Cacophis squamulosus TaxID=505434 RepID=R4G7F7_9SAUR